jgi:Zn-dependent protease with chaperone function
LFVALPVLLTRASWPTRAPRAAVILWQAIGLSGSLAAIATGLAIAVAPLHGSLAVGVARMLGGGLGRLNVYEAIGLALATYIAGGLTGSFVVTLVRTLRTRGRHRRVLDLVGNRNDLLPGTIVLDHPAAVAYCLPGLRPRIVLSSGTLGTLDVHEVTAVVAHERGHVHARHDLVMLPLASLLGPFHWLPYARLAPGAVSALLEMAADDYACRSHSRRDVAAALVHLAAAGAGRIPSCAFSATGSVVSTRVRRLAYEDNSRTVSLAALTAACAVFVLPLLCILSTAAS